jgi:hypothetical protein
MYRIYRNLHKQEYTVQHYIKGKGWRKLTGAKNIVCKNVSFKVYESGRQKVINERRKNVHAYVLADTFYETNSPTVSLEYITGVRGSATYNPYKYSGFVERDTERLVQSAEYAVLSQEGITTIGATINL